MIYKENFKIGLKDVYRGNNVSNTAILEYMENIAAYHSDSVGYGINTLDETSVSWILLDWKIEVKKRPKYGQTLKINTWSRKIIKYYAYRDFEIYDDQNNLCVIATSKWLLINNKTGKIEKIESKMADKYESETENCVFPEEEIEQLTLPEVYTNSIIYETKRKDIDIIGHMHNIYYLDLAYEAMPEEIYNKITFNKIRIMYKKEIKLGDTVKCSYAFEDNKHIVAIQSQDEKILHAIIELQ